MKTERGTSSHIHIDFNTLNVRNVAINKFERGLIFEWSPAEKCAKSNGEEGAETLESE